MGIWFLCKICAIIQEKWAFLWLWKVLFLDSMGQNLLGKIIKSEKIILKNPFKFWEKIKYWKYESENKSDLTVCLIYFTKKVLPVLNYFNCVVQFYSENFGIRVHLLFSG